MKTILSFSSKSTKNSEPLRYVLIGGLCALADITLLYLFVNCLNIWYLSATTISFVIITFFGYFGQKHFTFRNTERNHKKQLTLFFTVAGTGLLINAGFMFIFVSLLGTWYIIANIFTKFIVLVWNFLANKKITFGSH